jgi:hypothetical protein
MCSNTHARFGGFSQYFYRARAPVVLWLHGLSHFPLSLASSMPSAFLLVLPGALALACAQPVLILLLKSERVARIKGRLRGRRVVLPAQKDWPEIAAAIQSPDEGEALIDRLDREIRSKSYAPARELAHLEQLTEVIRLHLEIHAIELQRQHALEALRAEQAAREREAQEMERLRQQLEEQVRRAREYAQQQSRRRAEAAAARGASGWRRVLNLAADERRPDVIKRAYRALAQRHHPDKGGSAAAMTELNRAYASARKELGFR